LRRLRLPAVYQRLVTAFRREDESTFAQSFWFGDERQRHVGALLQTPQPQLTAGFLQRGVVALGRWCIAAEEVDLDLADEQFFLQLGMRDGRLTVAT
jgi:hypothetical protein